MLKEKSTKKNKYIKRIIIAVISVAVIILLFFSLCAVCVKYVEIDGNEALVYYDYAQSVEKYDYGIVPGAAIIENYPAPMLKNRLNRACQLYEDKKITGIIISDIKNKTLLAMYNYLKEKNIPSNDIYIDYGGKDTYSTIKRACEHFPDSTFYIFTQEHFADRAGYIINSMDQEGKIVLADDIIYQVYRKQEIREYLAKVKAFINVTFPFTDDVKSIEESRIENESNTN